MKIKDCEEEFSKYFVIRDKFVVRLSFAALYGNAFLSHRDPIWIIFLGKSSAGKSTLLAPILKIPSTVPLDDLTEKTFLSGFGGKGKLKDNSLLHQIGRGTMVFSDLTPILSKNEQSSGEILSQLRMVHDGNFIKYTGTGKIEWHGKIGLIAASTHEIFNFLEKGRSMGERFSYYEIESATDEEVMEMQGRVNLSAKEVADMMGDYYEKAWMGMKEWEAKYSSSDLALTDNQTSRLNYAASFCVRGKATVHTDFKTKDPDQLPAQANVGRDVKMFRGILQAMQNIDQYENNDPGKPLDDSWLDLIEKMAYSSMSLERRIILEIMAFGGLPMTASEIGANAGLGFKKESVEKYLTPLHAIGIVEKHIAKPAFKWSLKEPRAVEFIKRVAWRKQTDAIADGVVVEASEITVAEIEAINFDDNGEAV